MDKERTRIALTSLGFFGIAIFLLFFFGIAPLWKSIKKDDLELKKVNFQINNLEEKRKKIKEYKIIEENLKSSGELVKGAVLKKGEEVSFVQELESVAQSTKLNLEIKDYAPPAKKNNNVAEGEKVKEETIDEMKVRQEAEKSVEYFQLNLQGEYSSILEFIYKLENMGRCFEIKSIKIANLFETKNEIDAALRQKQVPDKFLTEGEVIISFSWQ